MCCATLYLSKFDTEVAFTIGWLLATFFAGSELTARQVASVTVFVNAVAADLGPTRTDTFVVVVTILNTLTSVANAVAIAIFVFTLPLRSVAVVIDDSVAVVVFVVSANFLGSGKRCALAGAPGTVVALLDTLSTNTDVSGVHGTVVARLGLPGLAYLVAAAFVDGSVTVVVLVVATRFIGCWFHFALTSCPLATNTDGSTAFASSYTVAVGWTGVTIALEAIVDLSVAIVVFVVANLIGG